MFGKKDPTDRGSDFDFDDNFDSDLDGFGGDFDDYDSGLEDGDTSEKNRKPVTKALKNVRQTIRNTGRAAVMGAGRGIADKIEKLMPEVGTAYRGAVGVATEANILRNDIKMKAMPVINETKRTARSLAKQLEGQLPLGIDKKILKLLGEEEEEYKTESVEDSRSNHIDRTLGEIFKLQTQKNIETQRRDEVNRFMDRRINQSHHTEIAKLLSTTQAQSVYQTAFLRGPFTAYLKKDLELKYKHFYTAQDTLGILKNTAEMLSAELEAIKKNTGLPDVQKVRTSEIFGHQLKEKFTQSFSSKISDYFGGIRKNIMEEWVNPAVEGMTNLNDMLSIIGDTLENEQTMAEMGGGSDKPGLLKRYTTLGGWASIGVEKFFHSFAGKKVRQLLEQVNPSVRRSIVQALKHGERGIALLLNRIKSGSLDLGDTKLGQIGDALQPLIESILPDLSDDRVIENVSYKNLREASPITRQFTDTVERIIPGYLAMQTRYLEMMATHRNAEELQWDWKKQDFVRMSEMRKNMLTNILGTEKDRTYRQKQHADKVNEILAISTANDDDRGARRNEIKTLLQSNMVNFNTMQYNIAHSDRYMSDIETVIDECARLVITPDDQVDIKSTFYKEVFGSIPPTAAKVLAHILLRFTTRADGEPDPVSISHLASNIIDMRLEDDERYRNAVMGYAKSGQLRFISDKLKGRRLYNGDLELDTRDIGRQAYSTSASDAEVARGTTSAEREYYDRITNAINDDKREKIGTKILKGVGGVIAEGGWAKGIGKAGAGLWYNLQKLGYSIFDHKNDKIQDQLDEEKERTYEKIDEGVDAAREWVADKVDQISREISSGIVGGLKSFIEFLEDVWDPDIFGNLTKFRDAFIHYDEDEGYTFDTDDEIGIVDWLITVPDIDALRDAAKDRKGIGFLSILIDALRGYHVRLAESLTSTERNKIKSTSDNAARRMLIAKYLDNAKKRIEENNTRRAAKSKATGKVLNQRARMARSQREQYSVGAEDFIREAMAAQTSVSVEKTVYERTYDVNVRQMEFLGQIADNTLNLVKFAVFDPHSSQGEKIRDDLRGIFSAQAQRENADREQGWTKAQKTHESILAAQSEVGTSIANTETIYAKSAEDSRISTREGKYRNVIQRLKALRPHASEDEIIRTFLYSFYHVIKNAQKLKPEIKSKLNEAVGTITQGEITAFGKLIDEAWMQVVTGNNSRFNIPKRYLLQPGMFDVYYAITMETQADIRDVLGNADDIRSIFLSNAGETSALTTLIKSTETLASENNNNVYTRAAQSIGLFNNTNSSKISESFARTQLINDLLYTSKTPDNNREILRKLGIVNADAKLNRKEINSISDALTRKLFERALFSREPEARNSALRMLISRSDIDPKALINLVMVTRAERRKPKSEEVVVSRGNRQPPASKPVVLHRNRRGDIEDIYNNAIGGLYYFADGATIDDVGGIVDEATSVLGGKGVAGEAGSETIFPNKGTERTKVLIYEGIKRAFGEDTAMKVLRILKPSKKTLKDLYKNHEGLEERYAAQVETPKSSTKAGEYKRPYDTKTQRNILLNMLHVQEETYKKIASGIPFFGIEDFKDFLAGLQLTMSGAIDWTKEKSKGFLDKIKSGIGVGWAGIKSGAGYAWNRGKDLTAAGWGLAKKGGALGLDLGKKGLGLLGDGARWAGGKLAQLHPIERLFALGGTLWDGLRNIGSIALEGGKNILGAIGKGLSTAKDFLTRAKDPFTDVWVTDSNGRLDHVAIKGSDIAQNKETRRYFYQSGNGGQVPIKSAYGIDQPVYTYEDDKLVCVISADDIKRGLYDAEGHKLTAFAGKSILGKMAYAPVALAGAAMRGARAVGRGIKSVISKIGTGFANAWNGLDIAGWWNDNVKLPEWLVTKKTLEEVIGQRLLNIYNLLDERLAGKKIRKGSYEDAQQQKKEREEAKRKQEATPATPDKEGKGGFWSRLFGSLFGGKNKSQEEDEDDDNGGFLSDLLMWTGINKLSDKVGGWFRKGKTRAKRGARKAGGFFDSIADGMKNQRQINKSIARHARKTGQAAAAQNPNFFGRMLQGFHTGFTKGGGAGSAKKVLPNSSKSFFGKAKDAIFPRAPKVADWVGTNAGKLGSAVNNSRLTSMFIKGPWSLLGRAAGGALGMAGSALGSTLGLAGQALGLALRAVPVVGTILTAATVAYKLYDWATDSAPVKALRPARFKGYGLLNKHWEAIEDLETDTWDAMRSGQQGVDDDRLRMFGEKVGFITSGNSWGAIGKDFIGMGSDPDTDPIKNKIHFLRLWYKHRFLPVYATYISVFKAVSGDQDGSRKPWGDDLPDPSLAYEINKRVEANLGDVLKGDRLKLQLDAQHYATWLKGKIAYKNKKREENAAMDALHGASDRNLNTDYGMKTLVGGFKETGFTFKTAWNEMMHGNLLNALGLAIKGVGQLGATVITFPYKVAGAIAKGVWRGLKDLTRGGSKNELAWDKVKAELYNLDNNDKNKVLIKDLETVTLSILDGERPPMDREEMEEWAAKFIPAEDAGKILARANSARYSPTGSDGEEIRSVNRVHSESVNYIATWYKQLFVPIFTLYVNLVRRVAKMGPGDRPNPDDIPAEQKEAVLQAFYREGMKLHAPVSDIIPTTQAFTEWLVSSKEERTSLVDVQKTLDADNGMDKWDRAINQRWSKAKQHYGDAWTKLKEGNLIGAAADTLKGGRNAWAAIGNWVGKVGSSIGHALTDLFGDTDREAQWKNRFEYYGVKPPVDKQVWLAKALENLEEEQTKFIDNEIDAVDVHKIQAIMINTYNRLLTTGAIFAGATRAVKVPQQLKEYATFWYNTRFKPVFGVYSALVSRLTNRVPGDDIDVDAIPPKLNAQAWNEFVKLVTPIDDKVKQFTIDEEGYQAFLQLKAEHEQRLKSGQKGDSLLEKNAQHITDVLEKRLDKIEKNDAFREPGDVNQLNSDTFKALNRNFAADVQNVEDMLKSPDPTKVALLIEEDLKAAAKALGVRLGDLYGNNSLFGSVSAVEAQWVMALAKAVKFPFFASDANAGNTDRAEMLEDLREVIYKLVFGANAADSDDIREAQQDLSKFLHKEWLTQYPEKYAKILMQIGVKASEDVSQVPEELDTFVKHWLLQVFTLGYTYWTMTVSVACEDDPYNPPKEPTFSKIKTGLRGKAYLHMFLSKIGSYISGVNSNLDLTNPDKFKTWLDSKLKPQANKNITKREEKKAMTAAQQKFFDALTRGQKVDRETLEAARGNLPAQRSSTVATNDYQVNSAMRDIHGITTQESDRVVQQALRRDLKVDAVKVTVDGSAAEKRVWEYLTKTMGITPEQAAGIMGNIKQESGFNPTALNKSSGAFGLLQWLGDRLNGCRDVKFDPRTGLPSRKLKPWEYWGLIPFAKSMGKDPSDIEAQLAYMGWEMTQNSTEKNNFKKVIGIPTYKDDPQSTIVAVARSWRRNVERCGEAEAYDAKRAAYGIEYYRKFANGSTVTTTKEPDVVQASQVMEPVTNNGGQHYQGNDLEGYDNDEDRNFQIDKDKLTAKDYRKEFGTSQEARAYYSNSKSEYYTNEKAGMEGLKDLDTGGAKVVRPTDSNVITSQFGPRNIAGNRGGGNSNHKGIDLRARMGDPIYAMMDGKVLSAGGAFNTVEIDHGSGLTTRYLHNSKIIVKPGAQVKAGQIIALAGGKGPRGVSQYTPHLHLGIYKNGKPIDPEMFLRKAKVELTVKGGGAAHQPPLSDVDDEVKDKKPNSNDGEARSGDTAPNAQETANTASNSNSSTAPVQQAATSADASASSSYVPASATVTTNPNVTADTSVPASSAAGDATYQYTPVVNALKIIEAEVAAIKNKLGATTTLTQAQTFVGSTSTPATSSQATAPSSPDAVAQAVAQAVTQALRPLVQALVNNTTQTSSPSTTTPQRSKMDNGVYDVNK